MIALQTILYATDFSDSSERACAWAGYMAELAGARLHVLHVTGAELSDKQKRFIQPQTFEALQKEIEHNALVEIEDFCRKHLPAQLSCSTEVAVGKPYELILEIAGKIGADLIVMGTHGRTGLEHLMVGSTAERVVRKSGIPVLTIRQKD